MFSFKKFQNLGNKLDQFKTGLGKVHTFLHSVKNRNPFTPGINNIQTGEVNYNNFKQEFAQLKNKIERNYKGYDIDCLLKNNVVKFKYQDKDLTWFNASGTNNNTWQDAYRLNTLYNDDKTWKFEKIQTINITELTKKLFIHFKKLIFKVIFDQTKLHMCAPTSKGGSSNATYRRHERSRSRSRSRSSSRKNYKRTSVNRVRSVNHTRKYLNRK